MVLDLSALRRGGTFFDAILGSNVGSLGLGSRLAAVPTDGHLSCGTEGFQRAPERWREEVAMALIWPYGAPVGSRV
jgi:hypothetical protein